MKEHEELIRAERIHEKLCDGVKVSDIEKSEGLARAHIYFYRDLHNLSDQTKSIFVSGLMALKPLITVVKEHGESSVIKAVNKIDGLRAQQIQAKKRSKNASRKISEQTLNKFILESDLGESSPCKTTARNYATDTTKVSRDDSAENERNLSSKDISTEEARNAIQEIRNVLICAGNFSQEISSLTLSLKEHEKILRRLGLFEQYLDDIDALNQGDLLDVNDSIENTNQDKGSYIFESVCDDTSTNENYPTLEINYEDFSQDPSDYYN